MKHLLTILLVLIYSVNILAQDDIKKDYGTISTDRPDQTEASNLVPKNFSTSRDGCLL